MAGSNKQREELAKNLVSLSMEIIGKTYDDAMNTPEFWLVYRFTPTQFLRYRTKAMFLIRKTLKCNKKKAEFVFDRFEYNLKVE